MVYHYYQRYPCTVMNRVFQLTTPDIVIGTSTGLFMIFCEWQIKYYNRKRLYLICINIDDINQTTIVIIAIYSPYTFAP